MAGAAGESGLRHTSPDPVLGVGDHRFSARDIALEREQIAWKYPDHPGDAVEWVAYDRLIRGYLLAEVLEAEGHPVTRAQLQAELERIEEDTQRPAELDQLQAIFADAPGAYATLGILPQLANRRYFFEVFPELDGVQAERRQRAARMRHRLEQGEVSSLEQAAEENEGWRYGRFLFHPERGFLRVPTNDDGELEPSALKHRERDWADRSAEGEKRDLHTRLEKSLFSELAEGEVFGQIVEFDRDFAILRSLGWHDREQGIRLVGRLSLPKVSAHAHFWERAREIPVWVEDEALRQRLLEHKPRFDELDWREALGDGSD